jgi:carbohydrate-selective porin OprB
MVDIRMDVKGMRELEASLRALQAEYGGKAAPQALRPAMRAAMAPLVSDVTSATPVDSGSLVDSVKLKIGKPTKKMSSSQYYNSSTILYGQVGWFWSNPSLWNQALAVEFGTQDTPARNVLRGVHEQEAQGMLQRFGDTLGPAIEKKAAQLAKKRI